MYGGGDWVKSHEEQAERARTFTRAMHSYSMGPARTWPEALDLSGHQLLLDIGGGSGAHCIGAALRWPNLQAVVFDIAPVCEVAGEFIARHGLQSRIRTQRGDMWNEPFPSADLHFYSLIYHDWPPEKCRVLTRKSFESLEPGGRLIIHEMLYHDDKTGPLAVAACNMLMLWATEGEQYSGQELSAMLAEAGFTDIEVKPTWGYWSIVTGRKP
jgi:SAM-dependent methyltransferase